MTILAWAQEELYKDNRNVIDFLEPVAQATDRTPILLAQEDTIDYSPGLAIFMIDFLVESHEEAYRRLLASSQEALKYGAPSETLIGQFVDKITDVESIKQQNAKNAIELANQEIDIEYINTFVCHSLKRNLAQTLALIASEKALSKDSPTNTPNELQEKAQQYAFAIKYIENSLKSLREREAAMSQDTTLTIKKVGDGTFAVTISQHKGTTQIKNDITGKDFAYKESLKKDYLHSSRTMNIGKKSSVMKMDSKSKYGVLSSSKMELETANPKKENEKVKSLKEKIFGELTYTKTRSMKARGTKQVRSDLRLNAVRFKDKKIKIRQVKGKTKETELINSDLKVLSTTITTKGLATGAIGTPTISIGGNLAEAQLGSHGININAALGAQMRAGQQISVQDIAKSAAEILSGEMKEHDGDLDLKAVIEKLTGVLNNIAPDTDINWGNIQISAKGVDLINIQVEEQTQETEPEQKLEIETAIPIKDEIQGLVEDIEQALDSLEEIQEKLTANSPQQEQKIPTEQTANQLFSYETSNPTVPQTAVGNEEIEAITLDEGPVR